MHVYKPINEQENIAEEITAAFKIIKYRKDPFSIVRLITIFRLVCGQYKYFNSWKQ